MIQYTCEHCNEQLEAPDNLLGGELRCPKCQSVTNVPAIPEATVVTPPSTAGVTVPFLISAISNIIAPICGFFFYLAVFPPFVIICAPLGLLLWVLCIFEFIIFAQADSMSPKELGEKAYPWTIVQIVAGFLFNPVTLVCGIIALIHAVKLRKEG